MDLLDRPIFVISAPQSGATFLHEALGRLPGVRAADQTLRNAFDGAEELRPAARGHDSNRRTAADLAPDSAERIRSELRRVAGGDSHGRLLDSAPRHALRIPFLDAVLPDALFVYLYRSPRECVTNMVEAWRSGRYVTYPRLPGWPGPPWSLLLVPGWRDLAGLPLPEIAAAQWAITTRLVLDDLESLAPERWCVVDHAALRARTEEELARLCDFLGLEFDPAAVGESADAELSARPVAGEAPLTPEPVEEELQAALPRTIGLAERARDLLAAPVSRRPTVGPDGDSPVRSSYTVGFATALRSVRGSLLLSAPALGKLICVRHDGIRVGTHFRDVPEAGTIATTSDGFAIASGDQVWLYEKDDALLAQRGHERAEDAWFVPRRRIDPAEAGFAGASHEPRRHRDRLYLLETDRAELCEVEEDSGGTRVLAELPGRPRSLALAGSLAFVAVSPSETPAGEADEHGRDAQSGIWVVELSHGSTLGYLRFEAVLPELGDIAVLAGARYPEIAPGAPPD